MVLVDRARRVALLALGLLVIVSSRARTTQEANQLGGAVILPLIFLAAAQASTLMLLPVAGVDRRWAPWCGSWPGAGVGERPALHPRPAGRSG